MSNKGFKEEYSKSLKYNQMKCYPLKNYMLFTYWASESILNYLHVCGISKLKAELGLHQGMQWSTQN